MVLNDIHVQTNLDNTVGALFLGAVFGALVSGINILQSYFYFHEFPNDSRLHKVSVLILCVLDALHFALVIHSVYTYIVTGFGDAASLATIAWSIKLQVSLNVVVIFFVQCLYATRVWLLGGYPNRSALSYIVVPVIATGLIIGIVFSYLIYTVHFYTELSRISWVIITATSISTWIDFVIAAAMCYYLAKSKGQIRELNSRISSIIQYTLASGLLTSACSLSTLVSYVLLPNTLIYVALQFFLTKLYVGSYLAMLNARVSGTPSIDMWRTSTTTSTLRVDSPLPLFIQRDEIQTLSSTSEGRLSEA